MIGPVPLIPLVSLQIAASQTVHEVFERDCDCVKATYGKGNQTGRIAVNNFCRKGAVNGTVSLIQVGFSIYLSIDASIYPAIYPSIYLSLYLFITLSIYLSIYIYLSI
jgi:hypothetical protein